MSDTQMTVARAPRQLQKLEYENALLQKALDDCKAQLMMHLREDNDTPDATLQKRFESLFASMETWIDDVLYDNTKDFRESYDRALRLEQREGVLEDLGLYTTYSMSASSGSRRRNTISKQVWDRLVWLGKQKYCNCVILSLAIWSFLSQEIFDQDFPIGMPSDDARGHRRTLSAVGFTEIVEIMDEEDDDGPLGLTSQAARWKAETLTALTKTATFQKRRAKESANLLDELTQQLRTWITLSPRAQKDLKNTILEPAIDLHTALKCSRHEYVLEHRSSLAPDELERDPNQCTLKNISTWRSITAEPDVVPFHHLFPGLYKVGSARDGSQSSMELVKPVIIVYKIEDIREAARVTSSLVPAAYPNLLERWTNDAGEAPIRLPSKSNSFPQPDRNRGWWPLSRG